MNFTQRIQTYMSALGRKQKLKIITKDRK